MFSSNLVGSRKNIEVRKSQNTDNQPIISEKGPRWKELFLKVFLETVSLRTIGIAYEI